MTKDRQAIHPHQQGFTLIEIMVTLGVLAIVATLVSPAIMQMAPNMRLRTATNDLHANLMRAKSTAVKDNRNIGFIVTTVDCTVANFLTNFPQNGGAYQIFIDDGAGVPANARNNRLDGETVLVTVDDAPGGNDDLPESIALCNQTFPPPPAPPAPPPQTGSLGFTSTGLLQNAAGGNLILISTQGDRYQITLSPAGSVSTDKL